MPPSQATRLGAPPHTAAFGRWLRIWPVPGWLALTAAACVAALWASIVSLSIHSFGQIAVEIVLAGSVSVFSRVRGRWPRLREAADALGLWIALPVVGSVLTYCAARCALPLRDAELAVLDHAMGFDRIAWTEAVHGLPWASALLHVAYGSLALQILFSCAVLPFAGERGRARALFWYAGLATTVTVALSAIVPAAFGAAHPPPLGFEPAWQRHFLALRQDGPFSVAVLQMQGIVTFPSFHTTLAVLFAYSHRRTGFTGLAIAALNAVMIVSTVSEGGHYLTDVIAGLVVAWVVIAGVGWVGGRGAVRF